MIWHFTLILSKPAVDEETAADKLYGGGCNDALFSVSEGVYMLAFDRKAQSLQDAVATATANVEKAGIGSRVERIEWREE